MVPCTGTEETPSVVRTGAERFPVQLTVSPLTVGVPVRLICRLAEWTSTSNAPTAVMPLAETGNVGGKACAGLSDHVTFDARSAAAACALPEATAVMNAVKTATGLAAVLEDDAELAADASAGTVHSSKADARNAMPRTR